MVELFSDKRINEALELLNEVAKDKREELSKIISTKYGNLKAAVENVGDKIQQESSEAYKELDENVHKNPWPYIAGTAFTTLLIGYLFGRSR